MNTATYIGYNTKVITREQSSSGGIFYSLARHILEQNGIVFGAAWNPDWLVDMCYIENLQDLPKLMGSKYIKADIKNTYAECKTFLDLGKPVLYSGLPCQLHGLKKYLDKDYSNLYLVDIACHGLMPIQIWKDYLETIKRPDAEIEAINFRIKDPDWKNYAFEVKYSDGKILKEHHNKNKYMQAFLSDKYLNTSCYNCKFKNQYSISDLYIGDAWGINTNWDNRLGTSFIKVLTEKGNNLLNSLTDLELKQTIYNSNNGCFINNIKTKPKIYNKDIFKKKVCIVTMNANSNIGGALQVYALQSAVKKLGYECDTITFDRKDRISFYDDFCSMKIVPTYKDYNLIKEDDYDIFIVGSDQIWRRKYMLGDYKEFAFNYPWLVFTANWNKTRFSYAASFGQAGENWEYTPEEDKQLSNFLKQYNAISVRELGSINDCKNHLNINAIHTLDPTFLLTKKDYEKLCLPINTDKEFIFAYFLDKQDYKNKFAEQVANKFNLDIRFLKEQQVTTWLTYIKNCKLVLTDSFHGIAFSLIFNKPFLYYTNANRGGARFDTLDTLFGIQNNEITPNSNISRLTSSIFTPLNCKINSSNSYEYLKNNLADVPKLWDATSIINNKKPGRKAFVMFLSTDNYIYYALHTYKTLLATNTQYPIYCAYTRTVSEKTVSILNKVGLHTFELNTLPIEQTNLYQKLCKNTKFTNAFTKLAIFNTNYFDKIVYLDTDLEIYKNIDDLMDKPHMSAVEDAAPTRLHDKYTTGQSIFCSGLLVWDFEHNKNLGQKIIKELDNLPQISEAWHDQSIFNYYYQDWLYRPELHLPVEYSYMVLAPNIRVQEEYPNIKVKHFITSSKTNIPFNTVVNFNDNINIGLKREIERSENLAYYGRLNNTVDYFNINFGLAIPKINIQNITYDNNYLISQNGAPKNNKNDTPLYKSGFYLYF